MTRRWTTLVALVVVVAGLGACSDSGGALPSTVVKDDAVSVANSVCTAGRTDRDNITKQIAARFSGKDTKLDDLKEYLIVDVIPGVENHVAALHTIEPLNGRVDWDKAVKALDKALDKTKKSIEVSTVDQLRALATKPLGDAPGAAFVPYGAKECANW